ncbi:MAG TPA: hypothetical protein VM344_06755, partial [Vitreimonas sp.]|nr:hypothetical protein [Vitreimonas sp.]
DILSAVDEVCRAGDCVYWFSPQITSTPETLGYLRVASTFPDTATLPFSWDAPPHNIQAIERTEDMEAIANHLTVYGADIEAAPRPSAAGTDATSVTTFGAYEDIAVYSDITLQPHLNRLRDSHLAARRLPRELVMWTPQPSVQNAETTLYSWDFTLGALVTVTAGPRLRGGFTGIQRVWGYDLAISDESVERVTRIYTGPDA